MTTLDVFCLNRFNFASDNSNLLLNLNFIKMKNKHFAVFAMMVLGSWLLAASCEKMVINGSDEPDDGEPNVVVQVMSYELQPFSMAQTRAEGEPVCTRLNFIVYDEAGTRIRQEVQQLGDREFGTARFKLAEGRYYLVTLAHSAKGNPTSTNLHKIGFTNKTGFTDTFLYADSLVVGEEEVDCELELKRIVSKVKFVFDDALPEQADSIRFYYEGGSGTFDAATGMGVVKSKQQQWYPVHHEETNFDIYTIPRADSDQLQVMVTTYKSQGGQVEILTEREINDIPIRRNCITTCRGSLFNPTGQHQVSISIDATWEDEEIEFRF